MPMSPGSSAAVPSCIRWSGRWELQDARGDVEAGGAGEFGDHDPGQVVAWDLPVVDGLPGGEVPVVAVRGTGQQVAVGDVGGHGGDVIAVAGRERRAGTRGPRPASAGPAVTPRRRSGRTRG